MHREDHPSSAATDLVKHDRRLEKLSDRAAGRRSRLHGRGDCGRRHQERLDRLAGWAIPNPADEDHRNRPCLRPCLSASVSPPRSSRRQAAERRSARSFAAPIAAQDSASRTASRVLVLVLPWMPCRYAPTVPVSSASMTKTRGEAIHEVPHALAQQRRVAGNDCAQLARYRLRTCTRSSRTQLEPTARGGPAVFGHRGIRSAVARPPS
jgi:hypothetical protein